MKIRDCLITTLLVLSPAQSPAMSTASPATGINYQSALHFEPLPDNRGFHTRTHNYQARFDEQGIAVHLLGNCQQANQSRTCRRWQAAGSTDVAGSGLVDINDLKIYLEK